MLAKFNCKQLLRWYDSIINMLLQVGYISTHDLRKKLQFMKEMLQPVESSRTYIQEAYCLHSLIYGMMYFGFFLKNKGRKSSERGYILFEKVDFDIEVFPIIGIELLMSQEMAPKFNFSKDVPLLGLELKELYFKWKYSCTNTIIIIDQKKCGFPFCKLACSLS